MRLKSVYISQYKNLKNFDLAFDGNSFIDVFVGKNGTGKSNLFEALIEIFRHLYEYNKDKAELDFNYRINFEIDGKVTEIAWASGQFKINGKDRKTIGETPLPDNVLIYYSGHNKTIPDLVVAYEESFRKDIKEADFKDSRRFIGIGPNYKELLLAVLLMQPNATKARLYIVEKLGIRKLGIKKPGIVALTEPVVKIVLDRPTYAKGANRSKYDIEYNDERDRYWKPLGIAKEFLDRLSLCITQTPGGLVLSEGYFASDDRYILYLDIAKVQHELGDLTPQDLFRQFDNLRTLGMLSEITVPVQLTNGVDTSGAHFSDGQFQSVYIYAIIELFKDRHCITLLDEPDSFLHPEWQFDFLKQVFEIADIDANTNHVLMSSHSAATLCSLEAQNISLFKIDNSRVSCSKRTKKEIVSELSNSFIQYSEDESKLLIDNVIRSSSKPILFVEGPSDVSIMNTAYVKLYPDTDIPVLIQDAFDRGFIRTLLARHEMFAAYPDKQFFALFDFDDAYNDWRDLGGEQEVKNIGLGLCRKLQKKKAHIFLLPIPDNELRAQVWDDANPIEKIIPKPHFCIEHVFWGFEGLDKWFHMDDKTGFIKFKGDKVRFAKEIVPTLDAACFDLFRPMFEFIKSKC